MTPEPDDQATQDLARSWRDFCDRMAALGDRLFDDDFPRGPTDRAEGFRHLAEQAANWIGWEVSHADPSRPAFQRQNDLVSQWGGPNIDNVYRHARIDPTHRYVIRGRMHGCQDFVMALRAGFMHSEVWGTKAEVTAADLGIGRGDSFEIHLGGDEPGAVPIPDGVIMVSFREYYLDWSEDEPATLTIECLDPDPPRRPSPGEIAERIDRAATLTEQCVEFWNDYTLRARGEGTDNTFAAPQQVAKGLQAARYAFCYYALGSDEALVIEMDVPPARYWSLQLYTLSWFEAPDLAHRVVGLNHTQALVDPDGKVRVVVAGRDPGLANWLDTGGRPEGQISLRGFWCDGPLPHPRTRVTAVDALAADLPSSPRVTADQRAAAVAARRRHSAWRFRT